MDPFGVLDNLGNDQGGVALRTSTSFVWIR